MAWFFFSVVWSLKTEKCYDDVGRVLWKCSSILLHCWLISQNTTQAVHSQSKSQVARPGWYRCLFHSILLISFPALFFKFILNHLSPSLFSVTAANPVLLYDGPSSRMHNRSCVFVSVTCLPQPLECNWLWRAYFSFVQRRQVHNHLISSTNCKTVYDSTIIAAFVHACLFLLLSVLVYLISCLKSPKRRRVLKKLKGRRILDLQPMGQTLQLLAKLLTDDSHKVVVSVTSCLCRASGYKSFRLKVWSNPQQCMFQRINIYSYLKIQTCCIWPNYADLNRPWFTIRGCWMTMTFKCSSRLV